MKVNLPPFYVGQRVVYITGVHMPKYSVHTVMDIRQHPCGCWIVNINDISIQSDIAIGETVRCLQCDKVFKNTHGSGFLSTSFRPLQEQKAPLMTFSEIKEVEKQEVLIMN